MMKKSYKFIIVATALVVIGFMMDGIFSYVPFSSNPQITKVHIDPGSDYSFQINSKGETKMNGMFSSIPEESPISLKIFNPDGSIVWEGKSQLPQYTTEEKRQYIGTDFFNPNSKGILKAVITNLGTQQVVVDGGIHDFVELKQYENELEGIMDVFFDIFLYSLISALLKFVGVVVGIISVVFIFKERKEMH
jgi:hypothetical protein